VAKVPPNDPGMMCLDRVSQNFKLAVSYQPAGRYWTFQWLEVAMFVALGLGAALATYMLIRPRRRVAMT
jgi:hypothetical protein